ncbi:hypothetical protein TPY_2951 [Sulfobacillus acidophilus TPY]|uniref:Dihydroxyacetone kinase DhaM subunit n=1 Tax=Sulfobacillus acidophilus (strain ATCC 700253 / DSM 10332 / NAL) TaxID=679936 RepID=G8TSR3_SULAD|nr:hypothetical protein TPY_2951 [Sulfobacillus acidophilus TPY]AEW04440.1 dihydroxyacetone kinase DhaM subunit [Sulfobacillus acidophilus DSM 10332]
MTGLLLVSHLQATAEGVRQLVKSLAGLDNDQILALGGHPEPGIAYDDLCHQLQSWQQDHELTDIIAIGDLGSSLFLLEQCRDTEIPGRLWVVDAPFLEGALAAAMAMSVGEEPQAIFQAAENAWEIRKR